MILLLFLLFTNFCVETIAHWAKRAIWGFSQKYSISITKIFYPKGAFLEQTLNDHNFLMISSSEKVIIFLECH